MRTIVHVNQHRIAQNRKEGTNLPPLIARSYKGSTNAMELDVVAPDGTVVGTFKYSPHKPLPCGARLWFETELEVREHRI